MEALGWKYSKSPTYEPSSWELSKVWMCVSGVSETAASPTSLITEDPSILPPPSSPSSNQ